MTRLQCPDLDLVREALLVPISRLEGANVNTNVNDVLDDVIKVV